MLLQEKTEYITDKDNAVRYVLGKYTNNPLIVFGINPSTATAEKNDATIGIVEKIAKSRNCDGYLMFNLYPQRATKIKINFPKECDAEICKLNYQYISERITDNSEVIAAWGTHILDRDFFVSALRQINSIVKQKNAKWICLCKTKYGHPHHPTRLAYDKMTFESFDMDEYLDEISRSLYYET